MCSLTLSDAIIDHLQQIKRIRNQPSTIGETIITKELIASTFKSLPKSYESFVTSSTIARKLGTMAFIELKGFLMQHEQLTKDNEDG